MKIEQVNIGKSGTVGKRGKEYKTGIHKQAVADRVNVSELGLEHDVIVDGKYHGGPDQAVYLYSVEDYEVLCAEMAQSFLPGLFGENLTTSGLDLTTLCVGDRLISRHLVLEVTAPRIPCNTLEARVGIRGFAKTFFKVGRSGAYCRVIETGSVGAADEFELQTFAGDSVLLTTFFQDMKRKLSEEELHRYLALPIDERNRADFMKQARTQV